MKRNRIYRKQGRQLQLLDSGRVLVLSAEDDPARVLKPQGE